MLSTRKKRKQTANGDYLWAPDLKWGIRKSFTLHLNFFGSVWFLCLISAYFRYIINISLKEGNEYCVVACSKMIPNDPHFPVIIPLCIAPTRLCQGCLWDQQYITKVMVHHFQAEWETAASILGVLSFPIHLFLKTTGSVGSHVVKRPVERPMEWANEVSEDSTASVARSWPPSQLLIHSSPSQRPDCNLMSDSDVSAHT